MTPTDAKDETPRRFSMWCAVTHSHSLIEKPDGAYVAYADYATLQTENERLAREREVLESRERMLQIRAETAEAAAAKAKEFIAAFKAAYPDIRQLQDGWALDKEAWTTWDESVRQKTIDLGSMVFDDALAAIDRAALRGGKDT